MNIPTLSLEDVTFNFFQNHWPPSAGDNPQWSEPWEFKDSVPNNEMGGCYAWLNDQDKIIYIGVALSMGDGIYKGHSLGHRISGYWKVKKDQPVDEDGIKLYESTKEGVAKIMTIGFPEEYGYLAAALELYLIQRLHPEKNKIYKYNKV
jgi:excinuclease UvrABC nuclease subunit